MRCYTSNNKINRQVYRCQMEQKRYVFSDKSIFYYNLLEVMIYKKLTIILIFKWLFMEHDCHNRFEQ